MLIIFKKPVFWNFLGELPGFWRWFRPCSGDFTDQVDGVTDFDEASLDVGGREFTERFAGDEEICGSLIWAAGGEDLAGFKL